MNVAVSMVFLLCGWRSTIKQKIYRLVSNIELACLAKTKQAVAVYDLLI